MIQDAIRTVISGRDLTRNVAYDVMTAIMSGDSTPAQIAAFLVAEKLKGETYHEVAGFVKAMRAKATEVKTDRKDAIDMCGTGGDGSGSFNISTVASFVVAAGGVPVAKHGNRSVSSACGSADLMEQLGIKIDLTPEQIGQCIDEIGIGFLFAPLLHGAMKHAVAPRREIGVHTVFNLLGPLTNPAGIGRQVMGVFSLPAARLAAEVFCELGCDHVYVLHSEDGLDEISLYTATHIFEVTGSKIVAKKVIPEDFGFKTQPRDGCIGGNKDENLQTALAVLKGKKGSARDFVIANAACGFVVGGRTNSLLTGAKLAADSIDSGAALAKVYDLKKMSNGF